MKNQSKKTPEFLTLLNKYKYTREQLANIVHARDADTFQSNFRSIQQLANTLQTCTCNGISTSTVNDRALLYGSNHYTKEKPTKYYYLMFDVINDPIMIFLITVNIISLIFTLTVLDIKQYEWGDSIAIFAAIIIQIFVSASNNYTKEIQLSKYQNILKDKKSYVIRDNSKQLIRSQDIVVGDIVYLMTGDFVPADGVISQCNDVSVDESKQTGQTHYVQKDTFKNMFLFSHSLIIKGSCQMLVTSVGPESVIDQLNKGQYPSDIQTPIQLKLESFSRTMMIVFIPLSILTFILYIIRALTDVLQWTDIQNFYNLVSYIMLALVLIVLCVPEGLPTAISLSFAHMMKYMFAENCLVKKIEACELLGKANEILVNKTGTLTVNEMRVVTVHFGFQTIFNLDQLQLVQQINQRINPKLINMFNINAIMNSTCDLIKQGGIISIQGNFVGGSLLQLVDKMGYDYNQYKQALNTNFFEGGIVQRYDFNSSRKLMITVIDLDSINQNIDLQLPELIGKNNYLVLVKGQAKILKDHCKYYQDDNGDTREIDATFHLDLDKNINTFSELKLRPILMCYKVIQKQDDISEASCINGLIFNSIIGLENEVRREAKNSIEVIQNAGIRVRMFTSDNMWLALAVAKQVGLILDQSLTVEQAVKLKLMIRGEDFRLLSNEQIDEILNTLVILARSSPEDKFTLVKHLREQHKIVASTGDGSADAQHLKEADIGIALGHGSDASKEAADIILLDNKLDSMISGIRYGRNIMLNIRKYIQFMVTAAISVIILTIVSICVQTESPFQSTQILYINLVVDALGTLALATEKPTKNIMTFKPLDPSASIITPTMIRNIVVVVVFQIVFGFCFIFSNVMSFLPSIFKVSKEVNDIIFSRFGNELGNQLINSLQQLEKQYRSTIFYNFIIISTLLNLFNSRRTVNQRNICEGIKDAGWLWGIFFLLFAFHMLIMFCPKIDEVFGIYYCSDDQLNLKPCFPSDLQSNLEIHEQFFKALPERIQWQTWLISSFLSIGVLLVHFIGRLIPCKSEFNTSEKQKKKTLVINVRRELECVEYEADELTRRAEALNALTETAFDDRNYLELHHSNTATIQIATQQ